MTDAERLEQQANLLFNNVSGWEQSVLTRIGKRIGKYSRMSVADLKTINNALIVKQDMKAITKELAKITGYNISQVEKMYSDVIEQQHLSNMPLYDYRNKPFIAFAENEKLQAIVKAFAKTTAGNMVNLSKIGASHLGMLDERGKFKSIEKFYAAALDKAVVQITSGSTDFYTAMRDTVQAMGGSGIRVNYPGTNITRRLDTAVRQSLLWGAKQASNAYNEMIGEELGCDGIEIDWHANPRPSHEFMQGKQYVLGRARVINGVKFESANEALERLEDYGCLHFKSPIICGVSEPRFGKKELERLKAKEKQTYNIDGKEMTGYEATQAMRRLETAVREQKAIKDIAQAEGDKELVNRCNKRIKTYQSKYDEISNITGIEKEPKRMSVSKGSNSVKSVDFSGNGGIIKENENIASSPVYAVKKDLTSTRAFISKIQSLTDDEILQRQFYAETKQMLEHRSGTNGEDLKLYNPRLNKWYRSTEGTEAGSPAYNDEILLGIKEALPNELIAFHNHPSGMPPSVYDFNAAYDNKYLKAYTIGHDGKIFEYKPPTNKIPEIIYNSRIMKANVHDKLSEYDSQIKALNELKEVYGLDYKEVLADV